MPRLALALSFALSLTLILGLLGCQSASGPGLRGGGPALRIGVAPDAPPMIFEQDGQYVGIEADFARRLGESLRRPVTFVPLAQTDLLPALEDRRVDVLMSGLAIDPEWEERVHFTRPYMQSGQLAVIRSTDLGRFGRVSAIRRAGARVGFERGSAGERYVAARLPFAESFGFDSADEALRSLRAERIDYFVHDAPTAWRIAGSLQDRDLHALFRPLTREELAWAVRPDDASLRAALDATLAHWEREGLIEPIIQRWIPFRVTLR